MVNIPFIYHLSFFIFQIQKINLNTMITRNK
nr:MAG TPA: hypothetical protein [Caudoviricetes sp.]